MKTLLDRITSLGCSHRRWRRFSAALGMTLATALLTHPPSPARPGFTIWTQKDERLVPPRLVSSRLPGETPGAGKFLVASEHIRDPNFAKTVVLLLSDDWHGSMGVVINRPSPVKLSAVLPNLDPSRKRKGLLFIGGPVSRTELLLLIRSSKLREKTIHVVEDIYMSRSPEALERLMDDSKNPFRAYAGYAGWRPGQLDAEVEQGDWKILRADSKTVFDAASEKIWPDLIRGEPTNLVRKSGGTGWTTRGGPTLPEKRPAEG